jgi:hypothetical protein
VATLLLCPGRASATRIFGPWQSSVFFGVGLGAGFDASRDARRATDAFSREIESYSIHAWLFGVHAGFRFNEWVGMELGWQEQQHDAFREWGGYAGYHLLHTNARLAWPLPTRQTLLFKLGVIGGGFEYGRASFGGTQDNATVAFGPLVALALEQELGLGVVAFFDVTWSPLRRLGMSGPLELYIEQGRATFEAVGDDVFPAPRDTKDFTRDVWSQLVWLRAGVQFEWFVR